MTQADAKLIAALERVAMFCDFVPAPRTPEQMLDLIAAIDCTAAMALREAGAVEPGELNAAFNEDQARRGWMPVRRL